ncbi:MAG TPA: nucleotidyltransferase family protein [Rhizomicrobium sp.]|jgi:molybdenum cofactor cytidylyltransferase|nr:nucleotidyltransferase family protein [Rhizomicrobium sp.]
MPRSRVAAVILAAGQSSRMGCNKLVLEIGGKPMLRHVAEAANTSRAHPVVAVVGNDSAIVIRTLEGLDVVIVENPAFGIGMSSSIRAGIAALPQTIDAALILLGDMPAVSPLFIDKMIDEFESANGREICLAAHNGRHGHPVLFARRYFPNLLKLDGDVGARSVVAEYSTDVFEVESDGNGPLVDIDTPGALATFRALLL